MANRNPKKGRKIKTKFTVDEVCSAIQAARGGVYMAARALGCSHATVYNYANSNQKVKDAISSSRGYILDKAEYNIYRSIEEGNVDTSFALLNKLGKDRGFGNKSEVDLNIFDKREEVKEKLLNALEQTSERLISRGYTNGHVTTE
jgi:undecaprenyl pyrophosphate synthase